MERGDLFLLSYGFLGPICSQNSDLFAKRRVASLDFFAGVLQILWLDICCSDSMNQNWESLGLDYYLCVEDSCSPGGILFQKKLGFLALCVNKNVP